MVDTTTVISLSPAVQALVAIAGPALATIAGAVVAAVLAHWKLIKDQTAQQAVAAAITRAAGAGFAALTPTIDAAPILNVRTNSQAVAIGVDYLDKMVPDAIKRLELTPEKLQLMVQAELSKLLAQSPTTATSVTSTDNVAAAVHALR